MNNNLISYVETVMDLEKAVFTQSQLQQELKKKIGTLGVPRRIDAPSLVKADLGDNLIAGMFLGGAICAIIGALLGLFSGGGFFNAIFAMIGNAISGAIIGAVIGFVGGLIHYFVERKRYEDYYHEEYFSYENEKKHDRERVDKENAKARKLQQLVIEIGVKRSETEELLQKYYDLNIIHKDYRSLQGLCAIFEYLEKGICTELQGPNGVYKELKKDDRLGPIKTSLAAIQSSLESIKNSQVMLYCAINEGNRNVKRLIEKTDRQIMLAEKNNELLEITNYNQQQQLTESRYQSAIQTYALMKWK